MIYIQKLVSTLKKILNNENDNIKHSIFMINVDKDFSRYSILHFDDAKYCSSVIEDDNAVSLLYFSKSRGVDIEELKFFLILSFINIGVVLQKSQITLTSF